MTLANKFEKAENKPVVIAYISAAAFAIFFSEWWAPGWAHSTCCAHTHPC
jgi:hypothetical protein